MKVLTATQMREVDRRSMEMGIPGLVLMENAGHRVVELIAEKFQPLSEHRMAILCGKGNNGGDGLVVARQLFIRFRPRALHVVLLARPEDLKGDAAANLRMLQTCGCPVYQEITPEMRAATIVVDALLGTGINGAATGKIAGVIREINTGFPMARIVSVDIPSGMPSDSEHPLGESVRADYTVTFTAPKISQALPPNCDAVGELRIGPIGSPPELYETDDSIFLSLIEPAQFRHLLVPRTKSSHKGTFGHVLVVAGSRGKPGAAAMAGTSALRSGAGLVTVASAESAISGIGSHTPELMTEPLSETETGGVSLQAWESKQIQAVMQGKNVLALGPGLGTHPETVALVRRIFDGLPDPMVVDADGLNALSGTTWSGKGKLRVLTPHPGEMGRLTGKKTADVLADRVGVARAFATERQVALVLKGQRTLLALPDGRVWINPTGTPALATGGSGDILTGVIAGFLSQFPNDPENAIAAAVYLHGLAGEMGASELGEKCLIATDLLQYLPDAMEECAGISDRF